MMGRESGVGVEGGVKIGERACLRINGGGGAILARGA